MVTAGGERVKPVLMALNLVATCHLTQGLDLGRPGDILVHDFPCSIFKVVLHSRVPLSQTFEGKKLQETQN